MKNLLLKPNTTLLFVRQNFDYRKIYFLPRKTTINMKLLVFQYKILNSMLYLNKMLLRFGKVRSPLCSFFKSNVETAVYLFSSCSLS